LRSRKKTELLERASLDALFTSNNGMRAVHVLFSSFEPNKVCEIE
jgi:hypothetical protein